MEDMNALKVVGVLLVVNAALTAWLQHQLYKLKDKVDTHLQDKQGETDGS